MRSLLRAIHAATVLALFATATPFSVRAADTALPPEAQEAMARGLAAARQQEWPLAIKHLTEARKIAPTDPQVAFNLALACDKAGGRELLAITLYRSYLAGVPEAANANQVGQRILELEVQTEAGVAKLIRKIKEMVAALPDGAAMINRDSTDSFLSYTESQMGDFEGALKTAALLADSKSRDTAYWYAAARQVEHGELEDSARTLSKVANKRDSDVQGNISSIYDGIFEGQLSIGNLIGAKEIIAQMPWDNRKTTAYQSLIDALVKARDFKGATDTVALLPEEKRLSSLKKIVRTQWERGDRSGCFQSLLLARKVAAGLSDEVKRFTALLDVAEDHRSFQDKAGVLELVEQAKSSVSKIPDDQMRHLSRFYAWAGDLKEAKRLAELIPDTDASRKGKWKWWAYLWIAASQIVAGEKIAARETVAMMTSSFPEVRTDRPGSESFYLACALAAVDLDEQLRLFLAGTAWKIDQMKALSLINFIYPAQADRDAALQVLRQAKDMALKLSDKTQGLSLLANVAMFLIFNGNTREAQETVSQALALSLDVPEGKTKDIYLGAISGYQSKLGDVEGAAGTAARIADAEKRDYAYRRILEAYVSTGDITKVRSTIRRLSKKDSAGATYYDSMADIHAARKEFKEAAKARVSAKLLRGIPAGFDECKAWSTMANRCLANRVFSDFQGYWEGYTTEHKHMPPGFLIDGLRDSVFEMAKFYRELRNEEKKWQANRIWRQ